MTAMTRKLLVVDDERSLTELLANHFREKGYLVYTALNGDEALAQLSVKPDLILLDINMPGIDVLEFCKQVRGLVCCPILFLTARITEQDKVNGLSIGGDDYITKPFSLAELTARVEAHLRRDARGTKKISLLTSQNLMVDLTGQKATYMGKEIPLSKREFLIIGFLLENAGQIFDRERIYEEVWGFAAEGDSAVVKEHIRKIRAKLVKATGKEYIETIWGMGYRWNK